MMEVAMITAPRRMKTLIQSVRSLRDAWFLHKIKIFAEPSMWKNYVPDIGNAVVSYNPKRFWVCRNSTFAIDRVFDESKEDIVFLAQDDFIYNQNTYEIVAESLHMIIDPDFWYLCLYTDKRSSRDITHRWWNRLDTWWHTYWALYVFSRESWQKIKNHPFYRQHVRGGKENERWDCCVAETTKQLWLNARYHNPSLAAHIWITSTIGHRKHAQATVKAWFREKKIDN